MNSQMLVYAIRDDFEQVLHELERDINIKYVAMGGFENAKAVCFASFRDIPNFGFTDFGDWSGPDQRFMIVKQKVEVQFRKIDLIDGGIRYIVDPAMNPDCVEFTPKGILSRAEKTIIAGRIGIMSNEKFAISIYKQLSSLVRKYFVKIGAFRVGIGAKQKLDSGWRLTQIERSPREYDLRYVQ